MPDPFITTYLRSNTGFGLLLDARLPVLTEADTIAVLEGDIGFALLAFEYQQAIVDFLAVRIGFTGGARGAWSPIDWFGLRGRVELGAGDAFDPESSLGTTILNLGVAADVDLLEVTAVPLGFLLGFGGQLFGSRGSDIADSAARFNLWLFYTDRKEFSVGVERTFGRVALSQSDESVDNITFNFRLRYFF